MSIFPTKILLATDGSEEARQAAQAAAELSKDCLLYTSDAADE